MEFGYLGEIVVVLASGVSVALLLGRARVALIASLVVAGVVMGPSGLAIVADARHVDLLADVGVALLLFGIGLELTPAKLRRLRREVFLAGTLQVGVTVALAASAATAFGLGPRQSIFLGCVAALSSTAVVLSRLDQRKELVRPHGRLALGILVMQDIAVVPMVLLARILGGAGVNLTAATTQIALKTAFVVTVVLVGRLAAPVLLRAVARAADRELFVVTTVLVCLGTAWLASLAGVALAVGAFLGGVVVATTQFRHQSLAQVVPLRDVFSSFFFVSIGMLLDLRAIGASPFLVLGLTVALIGGKALITFTLSALCGWRSRVALAAGLSLAQVGEFSFVLVHAAQGTTLIPEQLEQPLFAAIALSLLMTPVLVDTAQTVGARFSRTRFGRWLERSKAESDELRQAGGNGHVVIAGFGRAGRLVLEQLGAPTEQVCAVDLNPDNVDDARAAGCRALYGDVADPVVMRHAGAAEARAVVIAINDPEATVRAVTAVRSVAPDTQIFARAAFSATAKLLPEAGADDVVDTEELGAQELARRVATALRAEDTPEAEPQ